LRKDFNNKPGAKKSGDEWIWGRHSLEACTDCNPELIQEVFFEKHAAKRNEDLRIKLDKAGLKVNLVEKLPRLLEERRTQGLAAKIKKFPSQHFDSQDPLFFDHENQGILIDRVQDPQNYGAILRSAAALNAAFVIVGVREQCPLNGTVAQVSAGNLFRVKIFTALNVAKAALDLKENGYQVFALESEGDTLNDKFLQKAETKKFVWVVGSEEEGIQSAVIKAATRKVGIPMKAGVESLNVSNSAAIALYLGSQAIDSK